MGRVAEPDPDRGDVDGSAPDEVAFVEPGGDGAVLAQLAEGPFHGVALLVSGGVEGGRAAARAAAPQPAADLVGGLRDRGLDLALAQVSADRGAGVSLVAQRPPGPGPRPARATAGDAQLAHQRLERQRSVAATRTGLPGRRT